MKLIFSRFEASVNPRPSGGKISNKVLCQILVHFMSLYLKFRSFEALEVGFLSKNFWIGELRLIAIVVKKDPTT